MNNAGSDFRSYLDQLTSLGLMHRVDDPVDWYLEAGAINRYLLESGLPGPVYSRVKDSIPGMRLAANMFATFPGVAVALGLPADTDVYDIIDSYLTRFGRTIEPVIASEGVCRQNVLLGDDADLNALPAVHGHPGDGGRYLGTFGVSVTKDPDSDWTNWGLYRGMIHGPRALGVTLHPAINHGGRIMSAWHREDRPMPYAMFFGGDPLYTILGGPGAPPGVSEADIAGGMRDRPVELVRCETVDLMVPADAEIVVEGTISPGDVLPEGPFAEYPGYLVSDPTPAPVVRVTAITYRDQAILPTCSMGIPMDMVFPHIQMAANFKRVLLQARLPVAKVGVPVASNGMAVVVSTDTPIAGLPQRIAAAIWSDATGSKLTPYVIVVNTDVDPMDTDAVMHAIVAKCHPARDIHVYPGFYNAPLQPYLPSGPHKALGVGGANVLFDCTWPVDLAPQDIPLRSDFTTSYPDELKRRVEQRVAGWNLPSITATGSGRGERARVR
ncbi:UbiD family decarboxylase [Streptomyces sp. NPDC001455]|uniref:UbiD family decarboxylase n=1 Tax=unclassified Streptomyces TaxID=2593676 RepID=UPI003318883C